MPILRYFLGRKGESGADGINGLGSSDVNGFNLTQPLLDSFVDNRLTKNSTISYNRADSASYEDRYGRNVWSSKEEITNYALYSNNYTKWGDTFNRWSIIGAATDPFGGNGATEIDLSVDTDNLTGTGDVIENTLTTPEINGCVSFYIKVISGDVTSLDFVKGSKKYTVDTPTNEYIRVVFPLYFSSSTFLFSINPRGKAGARIALYGVQIEDTPTATDLIVATSQPRKKTITSNLVRQGNKGVLIEEGKTNLAHYSNDLSEWGISNAIAKQSVFTDAFGHYNQYVGFSWGSIEDVDLVATTDNLTLGETYTVSFWAYLTAGSLQSIIVSLGGAADVAFDSPSLTGFTRLSAKCVAGGLDNLTIKLKSQALNAELLISSVQIETGELTSYKQTGSIGVERNQDNFIIPYEYNFPKPDLGWSMVFGVAGMIDNNNKKTVFSNGLTTTSEFSATYQGRVLTINMGGNTVSYDTFDYSKVALVYDGVNLKFYGEKTLISTQAITANNNISTNVYIGYNGTDEYLNAYLKNFMAYNVALTENEIIYLMGS